MEKEKYILSVREMIFSLNLVKKKNVFSATYLTRELDKMFLLSSFSREVSPALFLPHCFSREVTQTRACAEWSQCWLNLFLLVIWK